MDEFDKYLPRWAKTTHDATKHENAFHPLICHLIDVASAARLIWEKVLPEITKTRLAKVFALENDLNKAGDLIAFLIGLHDLGKCSPPFALRGENESPNGQTHRLLDLYRNTRFYFTGQQTASKAPHNFVTSIVLPPILEEKYNFQPKLAKNIADIIGGHHGTFPDSNFLNSSVNKSKLVCGDENWRGAQRKLVETLANLFRVEGNYSHLPNQELDNSTAMIFAGLTTTADWIGSNADFFKCKIEDSREVLDENYKWFKLDDYLKESIQSVEDALRILGWTNWAKESNEKEFDELFPDLKDRHRDLQDAAIEIASELNDAGICVVESPTGEGKTEAAMFLADVFNHRTGARGVYFALPTQATSNQMFGRVREFLEARFKGENLNVQLLLQHGHASIESRKKQGRF
jgi:CRISPR-associated endonuclease/helicase Cas3